LLGTLTPDVVISSAYTGTSGFREETPDGWVVSPIENALKRLG